MARGRRGFDTETVTITSSRHPRASDEWDYEADSAVRKAGRYATHYYDDHDSMSNASKRQDRALLNDITSRLTEAEFARPITVPRSPRPVRATHVYPQTVVRGVPLVIPTPPSTPILRRRASISVPSVYAPIPNVYPTPPPSPRMSRTQILRAGSEPPPRSRTTLNPTADLAVRQAKRSLNRIENEMAFSDDEPYYNGDLPYHHAPPVQRTVVVSSRTPNRKPPSLSRGIVTRRSASLPRQLNRPYMDDIERDVEFAVEKDLHPPMSMTTLRSKAVDARAKMDRHRTLLDRYLPLDLTTGNDVSYEVENKYGELVQRVMPQLDPYRPKQVPVTSNNVLLHKPPTGHHRPGAYNNYGLQERAAYTRPPISEARRNARAVLCRTKRDPHYFS